LSQVENFHQGFEHFFKGGDPVCKHFEFVLMYRNRIRYLKKIVQVVIVWNQKSIAYFKNESGQNENPSKRSLIGDDTGLADLMWRKTKRERRQCKRRSQSMHWIDYSRILTRHKTDTSYLMKSKTDGLVSYFELLE